MAKKSFSKKEALTYAWKTFKKHWQFLIVVIIIVAAVNFVPTLFQEEIQNNFPAFNLALSLVLWVVQMLVSIGLIVISLRFVDGKKPEIADLYKHYNYLLTYFLSSLVYGLIVLVGLILLIVPGVIWAIRLQFYQYFIVDKNMGPLVSIKASGRITKGHTWNLFLLGLIFIGLSIVGLIAFGIGFFIAWPVIMLATAYVYRKIS